MLIKQGGKGTRVKGFYRLHRAYATPMSPIFYFGKLGTSLRRLCS
jgi:hypothetical protein